MRAPILLAVVAGALVSVSAQNPLPATPQAPAFRSGVELVASTCA